MTRDTSQPSRWYFGIFLALAGAAAIVSTSELTGEASRLGELLALLFGGFAIFSLWSEFRGSQHHTPQGAEIPHPACSMEERPPRRRGTSFPS